MTDLQTLLALWEQGLARAPYARTEAMLQQLDAGADAPRSIGQRNRRLLDLHVRLFGDELELTSRCPRCAAAIQINSRCHALTADAPDEIGIERLEVGGHVVEFRLPQPSDVVLVAPCASDDEFARQLARRCIVSHAADSALPDTALDAISRRMEALDPLALVSFALECPDCSAQWNAPLDIEHLLWTKVRAAAEQLLLDVDLLARVYGWTERDVFALSPTRRAAYLQLAEA